ncbi:MAG: DNA repair protein RecO [bacterium]|nr:DNA repair protein RecO [bacterium]
MANGLYQTEGIILNRMDAGEADRILTVFTKEFGMLRLFARGVRKIRSKLNGFLNIFSYARFGFVSGRETWHLIDAEDLEYFDGISSDGEKIKVFGRVSNFLERFNRGEGKDEVLWLEFLSFLKFLDGASGEELEEKELLFYARALATLGYLDEKNISEKSNLKKLVSEAIARSQL